MFCYRFTMAALPLLLASCARLPEKSFTAAHSGEIYQYWRDTLKGPSSRTIVLFNQDKYVFERRGNTFYTSVNASSRQRWSLEQAEQLLAKSEWESCQKELKAIESALEMYASDNGGRYPFSLNKLESYLKGPLYCPAAASDTYSQSYLVRQAPDAYSVGCEGQHHAKAGIRENCPRIYNRYDSEGRITEEGLLDPGQGQWDAEKQSPASIRVNAGQP
jgi:hypothetical protein